MGVFNRPTFFVTTAGLSGALACPQSSLLHSPLSKDVRSSTLATLTWLVLYDIWRPLKARWWSRRGADVQLHAEGTSLQTCKVHMGDINTTFFNRWSIARTPNVQEFELVGPRIAFRVDWTLLIVVNSQLKERVTSNRCYCDWVLNTLSIKVDIHSHQEPKDSGSLSIWVIHSSTSLLGSWRSQLLRILKDRKLLGGE